MNEPSGPQGPSAAHPRPSALAVILGHFYLFPVICVRGQAIQETEWCSCDKWHFNPRFSGVVIQLLSHVQLFVNPWTAAHQASLSLTISRILCKFMSIELVMPSSHLILCCHPLLCLQSFPASGSFPMSQLFASGGQSIGAPVSASVLPMNIQSGISFRID